MHRALYITTHSDTRSPRAVWEVINSALVLAVIDTWMTSGRCQHYWPYHQRLCSFFFVSCVLPTQGHVSSDGPTAAMETDALLLQVRGCGTNFQHI